MPQRKCPSCSGTGNVGLCRPCQGRGYFEFDTAEIKEIATRSFIEITKDIDAVVQNIEEILRDKKLIDKPKRYLHANKAAQSIIKEINELRTLKTRNPNIELLEEYLTKAQKFHDELKLLIDKAEPAKKPEKPKKHPKIDPRQQTLF